MKATVVAQRDNLVELELRATKEMTDLDKNALARLLELGQVGAEMQCRLFQHDGHLLLQLDHPELP